jgi:hypothetical protein
MERPERILTPFQGYVARESGYDPHAKGSSGCVNHSSVGTLYAVEKVDNKGQFLILGFVLLFFG